MKKISAPRAMIVAGIMSGTSADGIDIAFCRIGPSTQGTPRLKLLAHTSHPYPAPVRAAVLAAMDAKRTSTAELSRLHWRLGATYADALEASLAQTGLKPALIALHGQTVYHQATVAEYMGAPVRGTWQIGEASVIAERLRTTVISDFRTADLAAGGQGAPLVPMLDYTMFRHRTRNRVLLNLGGIANFTAIPAGSTASDVLAFDTGPANMVIDALMASLFNKRFDHDGSTATRGKVLQPVIEQFAKHPFFAAQPPKSCGREEFGQAFAQRFLTVCRKRSTRKQDAIATATSFTAYTLREAYARFAWPHLSMRAPFARGTDLIVAGGGARNAVLMRMIEELLAPLGIRVITIDRFGLPSEAKEAAAFALLGWLTWHQLSGNIPSATGATRPVVLGKVTYA